jgi:hypothetical protein
MTACLSGLPADSRGRREIDRREPDGTEARSLEVIEVMVEVGGMFPTWSRDIQERRREEEGEERESQGGFGEERLWDGRR